MSLPFLVAVSCAALTSFASSCTVTENVAVSGTAKTYPSPETFIVLVAETPLPMNCKHLSSATVTTTRKSANAPSAVVAIVRGQWVALIMSCTDCCSILNCIDASYLIRSPFYRQVYQNSLTDFGTAGVHAALSSSSPR